MLVRLAMTLSTVHGWSLPEPVDGKASSLSSHEHAQESAITGGVDGSRDRRQLAPPGCFSCDESCDGCDASCDGFWGWDNLARDTTAIASLYMVGTDVVNSWCGRFFSRHPRRYGGITGMRISGDDTGRYREIGDVGSYGQI